jgi:two-component system nitrogen regulation response regulator GlnG
MRDLEEVLAETLRATLPSLIDAERGRLHRALIARLERPLFAAVLAAAGGNQLEAARILGINRNTLRKRLRLLGLSEARVARPVPKF